MRWSNFIVLFLAIICTCYLIISYNKQEQKNETIILNDKKIIRMSCDLIVTSLNTANPLESLKSSLIAQTLITQVIDRHHPSQVDQLMGLPVIKLNDHINVIVERVEKRVLELYPLLKPNGNEVNSFLK